MVYTLAGMKSPTYGGYEYPWWALVIGWLIAVGPIIPLPIGSVMCLLKQRGSLLQVCNSELSRDFFLLFRDLLQQTSCISRVKILWQNDNSLGK